MIQQPFDPDLRGIETNPTTVTVSPYSSDFSDMPPEQQSHGLLRIIVIVCALIVLFLAILILFKTSNSHAQPDLPALIAITGSGFSPATISIKVGQSVVWTNNDTALHQVASDPFPNDNSLPGLFDPVPLQSNQTYGFTFNTIGTYTYHDQLHPLTYTGKIFVQK